ncbi:Enoyl-CoA hydratase [Limnobacter sp. 130]|uniref:crotonase/enoyl-CoA hydratase family protein n=1 Tax=Limnobacter sp. 130 TaxID=2653147 RepID=UPI0012F32E41|nr:crotonase/enoyl-CoA hydratase family protein [Limnobacter sp. 130]VWX34874.1 Enoyl-CoA hydratase [Limnobacter sp. 130]
MLELSTLTYEVTGRVARITLNRPSRGNGITMDMPQELALCVEKANIDPNVHVIALSGNGSGFCGGYDLVESAQAEGNLGELNASRPKGSTLDPMVQMQNHNPAQTWDPMLDYAMMSRNVKGFMSLFHSEKPVVCKVHGYCVAGGTDMALCSDLLVIAEDAKIGYPPARVWGCPTTSIWFHRIGLEKAKRLLFTGDCLTGKQAQEWGLAIESAPPAELDARFEALVQRIALMPVNQLIMMKLLLNQSVMQQGLHTTQILGTVFDGITRHTKEGYQFQQDSMAQGFMQAVRQRDEPFGDFGLDGFKKG